MLELGVGLVSFVCFYFFIFLIFYMVFRSSQSLDTNLSFYEIIQDRYLGWNWVHFVSLGIRT